MNNGTKPERLRINDLDYLKSFHPHVFAGTASYPQFPAEYLTDKTDWLPDQNADGLPFACTSYTTTKIARILGVTGAQVSDLEAVTHSNALHGYSVLAAIDTARQSLGWFGWRFVIQATGMLDYFDALRLAQVSGFPEQRGISIGTPWFPSWEQAIQSGQKILPMPTEAELTQAHNNPNSLPWHNYLADGWSQYFPVSNGQLLYRLDSWQGELDYVYAPREVINTVMDLYGTVAVTATSTTPPALARVPLPDWFWAFLHSWFHAY